jgi:hypothetical protein
MDYRQYRQLGNEGGIFRFTGGIESITDGHTLWVKGESLTIPVFLANTQSWLLPAQGEGGTYEALEKVRWNRISTLTEGAKVFVGGFLKFQDNRLSFVSTKENPLLVIFYDCPDTVLTDRIIRTGRDRNDYWNSVTPVSLVIGALSQLYVAVSFLDRPAFRLTVVSALVVIFTPVFPIIPPGLLFTVLYRRLAWNARNLRAYHDLVKLPLRYLPHGQESGVLSTGEKYVYEKFDTLPAAVKEGGVPLLIPEYSKERKNSPWYIYGVPGEDGAPPGRSVDPFVTFGVLPGDPRCLSRIYGIRAYALETFAWLLLLLGIGLNIVFILVILFLLFGGSL